jgi:hypothetical protein
MFRAKTFEIYPCTEEFMTERTGSCLCGAVTAEAVIVSGSLNISNSSARRQFTVVRVGTLSDPSSVKHTVNIWAGSAPSWACMDPAMDKIDTQPAPPPPNA